MDVSASSPFVIPNFIKATSPIGLRRLMLLNNVKLGGFVKYFDIQKVQTGNKVEWFAWYYVQEKTNSLESALKSGGSDAV